jgi:hypothetical protein
MEYVSIEVHTGRETLDLLQHVAVQHQSLIPYSLLVVLPVVSRAVFLSVGPSLIAVRFGSNFQLLSHGISFAMMVEKAAVEERGGGRRRRRRRSGKARVVIKLRAWRNGLPCP